MHSLKRQAPEPILPVRSLKHRRLSLEGIKGGCSRPRALGARWFDMGKDIKDLVVDTVVALLPVTIISTEENVPSSPPDEATSSSSPTSSSMISTPRQTPSPQRRSSNNSKPDETSTPKQTSDPNIRSPPMTKDTDARIWTPREPTLTDDTFQLFEKANFSTPKAPSTTRSPSSSQWTNAKDPSPDQTLKKNVLPRMEKLQLQNFSKSSTQTSDGSLFSDSKLGSDYSQKSMKRAPPRRSKSRQHIYAKVHKAQVRRDHAALREEMKHELYKIKKSQGYQSTYTEFEGLLDYERIIKRHVTPKKARPPSLTSFGTKLGSRGKQSIEDDDQDERFLQRALERAKATLNEPQAPKPNIPGIEEMEGRRRAKEEAIERLLRPPPLPTSLAPEEEKQVSALLHKRGVVSKFAREQVSDQDVSRLRPGQWLNDEIINFYGAMILIRSEDSKENPAGAPATTDKGKSKKQKAPLNIHYFSSFFWTKLTQEGYDKGRLAKWTKKIDIFSKDAILMAVNHGNAHWTAASINFRQKRFESYDSMNMAKGRVFNVLRAYVNDEHMNKKKKPFNFDGWENWAPPTTPQQENGYDCGVFTCQFLETLSRGEDFFNFSQGDMQYLRKRMIWEIGNGKFYDAR